PGRTQIHQDPTIPAVMFVFGVVGNLIAIVVLCKSRKEQKETTFYTRVYGPVTIATYVQNRWPKGDQLIICAMSIERYLAINHAYFYNHFEDKKLAGLTLCAIYASNVLFCTLPSMGLGKTTYLYPQTWCFIDWRTNRSTYAAYSYMCAGFSSFLILVTVLCNVLVCVAPIRMRRQFMRRTSLGTDAQISDFRRCRSFRRIAGAEIQMVILLIATSVVILICSIPLVVIPSQPYVWGPFCPTLNERQSLCGQSVRPVGILRPSPGRCLGPGTLSDPHLDDPSSAYLGALPHTAAALLPGPVILCISH
uniref:G-protein coupled receptors family 1 profile domain-containing protein n=1 Tax=Leptobrachium leishanense TaxID=445787 RepID=A0A8C5PWY7_9ANUR